MVSVSSGSVLSDLGKMYHYSWSHLLHIHTTKNDHFCTYLTYLKRTMGKYNVKCMVSVSIWSVLSYLGKMYHYLWSHLLHILTTKNDHFCTYLACLKHTMGKYNVKCMVSVSYWSILSYPDKMYHYSWSHLLHILTTKNDHFCTYLTHLKHTMGKYHVKCMVSSFWSGLSDLDKMYHY